MANFTKHGLIGISAVIALGLVMSTTVVAQPQTDHNWVQWLGEPGNGHWYAVTLNTGSWYDLENEAIAAGGHLLNINDANENQWVLDTLETTVPPGLYSPYIGGWQNHDNPAYSEPSGGWEWICGDPWTYENWYSGEPNDQSPGEDFLIFYTHYDGRTPGTWNDVAPDGDSFGLIEVVPEPATLSLLALGGLAMLRRRRVRVA